MPKKKSLSLAAIKQEKNKYPERFKLTGLQKTLMVEELDKVEFTGDVDEWIREIRSIFAPHIPYSHPVATLEEFERELYGNYTAKTKKKQVQQYTMNGKYIQSFDSITEAAKAFDGLTASLSAHLQGKTNSFAGFTWKYAKR